MKIRRRNISWTQATDEVAKHLAARRGMPVSELLERLVVAESKRKRGIVHLQKRKELVI